MFLYVCMDYADWQECKATGVYKCVDEFVRDEAKAWMIAQVERRLNVKLPAGFDPCYCFYEKPPMWPLRGRTVVCKIRVDDKLVLPFDDIGYVSALNCMNNKMNLFNSMTEEEDRSTRDATYEECVTSHERMFDVSGEGREYRWCGGVQLQAFVPVVTRDMVRKVWVYSSCKRLRNKRDVAKRGQKARRLRAC
jgi:hypothetical protein